MRHVRSGQAMYLLRDKLSDLKVSAPDDAPPTAAQHQRLRERCVYLESQVQHLKRKLASLYDDSGDSLLEL